MHSFNDRDKESVRISQPQLPIPCPECLSAPRAIPKDLPGNPPGSGQGDHPRVEVVQPASILNYAGAFEDRRYD